MCQVDKNSIMGNKITEQKFVFSHLTSKCDLDTEATDLAISGETCLVVVNICANLFHNPTMDDKVSEWK